jgi:type II secretory pathway pseudopilin PulG
VKAALVLVVLGVAAAVLGLTASGGRQAAVRVEADRLVGVQREASSAERARERTAATQVAATATLGPHDGTGEFQGVSTAVADLPVVQAPVVTTLNARDSEHLAAATGSSNAKDPVIQKKKGSGPLSAPLASFDGMCLPFGPPCAEASSCSCLPPDTNGAAGATQFVQMVNSDFAVYSKTGAVLRHATPINTLWSGVGGECAAHNDGDPVVLYDQYAGRWLLSQFVAQPAAGESYGECIAISQSGDATGAYNLYFFDFGPNTFLDYPHFGVWRDGYYMSANEFPTGQETSSGAAAIVYERDKMLAGQPARFVWFDEAAANPTGGQYIGQLPADADGSRLPPAGEPNVFAEVDDPASIPPTGTSDPGFDMRLWNFHVDWSNPQASTFGNDGQPSATLPVAPFVRPQCVYGYGDCALQKGGPQGLDVLGDRLMFRLAYRNFGDHESLLLNHTVKADAVDGIRWYEVRSPTSKPVIAQQGTYAPDDSLTNPLSRWMGSIAMDKQGNIALGYSASGVNDYPSLRYTGHAAGDAAGQMTQAEQVLFTGQGPQTEAEGRWGDYSELSVDPANDCTFWFTSEYLTTDTVVIGSWATRIGAFRFPGCK